MKKINLKKIYLILFSLFLSFLILELILSNFYPQKTIPYRYSTLLPIFEKHPVLKKVNKKNINLSNISDLYNEYNMQIKTDKYGFRREDTNLNEKSVIIFGDSQTFGHGVSNGEDYPNLLDKEIKSCQIINAGVAGADFNYYNAYAKYIIKNLNSDNIKQIIIGANVPGNDWYGFSNYDPKLSYQKNIVIDENNKVISNNSKDNKIMKTLQKIPYYSHTFVFLKRNVAPIIKSLISKKGNDYEINKLEGIKKNILDIKKMTEGKFDIALIFLTEQPKYLNNYPVYMDQFKKFLKNNNIDFLDLTPKMKENYTQKNDFWLPFNGHYNKNGHKFIANEIQKSSILNCK